jgi:hypothetical protein
VSPHRCHRRTKRPGRGALPGEGRLITVASFAVIEGVGRDDDAHPTWPGQGQPFTGETADDGSWYAWRVSGANHRELGRGTEVYADLLAVLNAIETFQGCIDRVALSFLIAPPGSHWTWRMSLDGRLVAMSSRAYYRQRECAYGATVFTASVRVAPIPTLSGRRQRSLQMNERRTPNDQGAYGLPAQAESPGDPLSVNLGRTPS